MNYINFFRFLLVVMLLVGNYGVFAQINKTVAPTSEDTTKKVHIQSKTRNLVFQTIDDRKRHPIDSGDVKLRQVKAL